MKNLIKIVVVDNVKDRNIKAVYTKEVNYQLFPGLYIYDPIEGKVGDVSYRGGVYEAVILKEHDLMPKTVEKSGLKKIL